MHIQLILVHEPQIAATQPALAIPVDDWQSEFSSSLRLFDVDITNGIAPYGTIAHTAFFNDCVEPDRYSCSYAPSVRRGLFIDDFIYAISYGGVTAHALDDLSTPVAQMSLPAPEYYPYYGGIWPVVF